MSVRDRLQRWWDKVLGRPPWYRDTNVTTTRSGLAKADKPEPSAPAELTLADDAGPRAPRTHRSAGVDPYSNDAGFAKLHGWDRPDRD